jgi:hypothetical protein
MAERTPEEVRAEQHAYHDRKLREDIQYVAQHLRRLADAIERDLAQEQEWSEQEAVGHRYHALESIAERTIHEVIQGVNNMHLRYLVRGAAYYAASAPDGQRKDI